MILILILFLAVIILIRITKQTTNTHRNQKPDTQTYEVTLPKYISYIFRCAILGWLFLLVNNAVHFYQTSKEPPTEQIMLYIIGISFTILMLYWCHTWKIKVQQQTITIKTGFNPEKTYMLPQLAYRIGPQNKLHLYQNGKHIMTINPSCEHFTAFQQTVTTYAAHI